MDIEREVKQTGKLFGQTSASPSSSASSTVPRRTPHTKSHLIPEIEPQSMLRPSTRRLARHIDSSGIPATASAATRRKKPVLSLDHFLQRQRVLALWRDIVRATNKIPDVSTRSELREFAKVEFERNRDVEDLARIRYLVSTGRDQFRSMSRYVDEMGM